jgi:hypothetical protein
MHGCVPQQTRQKAIEVFWGTPEPEPLEARIAQRQAGSGRTHLLITSALNPREAYLTRRRLGMEAAPPLPALILRSCPRQ